ncbi:MAG: cyclic nucleotide-binding domain-containing protein [Gammaproteobacteria bacterium]|nr:cyclic nucleotide-binding domain-containing protein [Gammaproteobacteria bacterium]MDH5735130.1 cyclic nucleotide-binding domain-containing protein [Gammaproteobacteria bacterium]
MSHNKDEQLAVLESITHDDREKLIKCSQKIQFTAGEMLVNVGENDEGVFILMVGSVEVVSKGAFGMDKVIAEIHQGSIFGELSFFDQQPRIAAVKARSNGFALHITPNGLKRLAASDPDLAMQLLLGFGKILSTRFRKTASGGI